MANWKKIITSGSVAELDRIIVSSDVSASRFSGSFYGDGSNLTGIESVVPYTISANDGSSTTFDQNDILFSSASLHGFGFTVDGTTVKRIRITTPQGLRVIDSPTFQNLTVSGDLTVLGNVTELQVTNVNVEDKFILLNSGSNSGDGGFIVQSGASGQGIGFGWDDSVDRFGVQINAPLASNSVAIAPEAYVANVIDISAGQSDLVVLQKPGNIKIENDEIFIYV